jgi:two-component system NarL family response regulator
MSSSGRPAILAVMESIRVLLVDDHRSFAEAISLRLSREDDLVVVGSLRTAEEAQTTVPALQPDVLLLDVEIGRDDGLALARQLRETCPGVATVMLSMRDDPTTASTAIRAGAVGFVTKDASTSELLEAIRVTARGGRWIQPRLLGPVLDELTLHPGTLSPDQKKLTTLSERELAVLQYMVRGYDRKAIARALFLSTNTVRTHTRNLLAKLELHSSLEAVALALRAGLRPADDPELNASV